MRIVVALGGNALSKDGAASAAAQLEVAAETNHHLVQLVTAGHELVIVHGNGPQIGNIILHEEAINTDKVPTMPIDVCGAMSQGQIGYWLQNTLRHELEQSGVNKPVASVVTQVEVDANDPAFANPSKPIGPFYADQVEAEQIAAERQFVVKEDAGRGWRRVVPSPKPINIVEADFIHQAVNNGMVIVAAGGGGIPVKKTSDGYQGVEAVIDKDFAAAKLAELIEADVLLILTAIDTVKINFGQPNEESLSQVNVDQAKALIDENHFAAGSMLPKIEAAIKFAKSKPGRKTVITSPEQALVALEGQSGTTIL